MRPLKVTPRHAITALALSPDGRQLGVVQSQPGFRIFDTLTGAEVARDTEHRTVREYSPTGHNLEADSTVIRLAEVTAGRPFLRFQTGWTRAGNRGRPPAAPETSALPAGATISWTTKAKTTRLNPSGMEWWYLWNGALSADHRFVVGLLNHRANRPCAVRDLATERTVATLDLPEFQAGAPVQLRFTPDCTGVVALTPHSLSVFDLPLPEPAAHEPRSESASLAPGPAAVLSPSVVLDVTKPQPTPGVPPFSLLPCGRKVIVRGEKSRIELRDLVTGEVLTVWRWGLPLVTALAVAGDGLTAAAAGTGGHAVIWDLG